MKIIVEKCGVQGIDESAMKSKEMCVEKESSCKHCFKKV